MRELLTNAQAGWLRYTDAGKYAALLVLVLLFLWFRREEEKEKLLLTYTTLVTVLCIVPFGAVFLMTYQTRFYGYERIWNYVPVTLVIAYGGTIFLAGCWERYRESIWKRAGITVAVLALLLLCGGLGEKQYDGAAEYAERMEAREVLAALTQQTEGQEVCLWAPQNIMAEARAYDGRLRLIYGRNIWDASLGAYSYETYSAVQESLYLWMCRVEETGTLPEMPEGTAAEEGTVAGDGESAGAEATEAGTVTDTDESAGAEASAAEAISDGVQQVEAARAAGVNWMILPGNVAAEEIEQLAAAANIENVQQLTAMVSGETGEYYLLKIK